MKPQLIYKDLKIKCYNTMNNTCDKVNLIDLIYIGNISFRYTIVLL